MVNAIGLGPTRREAPADGGFVYSIEQEWWLPSALLDGIVPAEGDFITDAAGVAWWLQSDIEENAANIAGSGDMYRVVTRRNR